MLKNETHTHTHKGINRKEVYVAYHTGASPINVTYSYPYIFYISLIHLIKIRQRVREVNITKESNNNRKKWDE